MDRYCPAYSTPVGLPVPIAKHIGQFTGRTWLLPQIFNWLKHPDQRLFLLTGGPGTGKSMVSAWLAGYGPAFADAAAVDQLARIRALVKGVHFCVAGASVTPHDVARGLARSMATHIPGYAQALVNTAGSQEGARIEVRQTADTVTGTMTGVSIGELTLADQSPERAFEQCLCEPLEYLYRNGYDESIILLIDSLDEAETWSGTPRVAQLLASLTARMSLSPRVRILATTRPDPRILKYYREIPSVDLILDAPPAVDDVGLYVKHRMAHAGTDLDNEQCTPIARRISNQAGGVFLYAAMVLDDLLPRLGDVPDLEHFPLPDGLSGLYHTFLNRELGRDEDRWFDRYEPLLGLIAVAQGDGLTTAQFTAIMGHDPRNSLRTCKQYLSGDLPDGPFRPFHRSFVEFLLEDKDNVDYHINGTMMHRRIADYCRNAYKADWREIDETSKCYSLNNLATHLYHAGDDQHLADLITQQSTTVA